MKTIRLLLADDHHLFRKGLASLLEKEAGFEVVAEAEDGAEAIKKAQAVKPASMVWKPLARLPPPYPQHAWSS